MKRLLVLAGVLVLALAMAAPVAAAPPVFAAWEVTETSATGICPDVDVWEVEVYRCKAAMLFDGDGNLTKFEIHCDGTDNLYNAAIPDRVLTGNFAGNFHADYSNWGEFASGLSYHITIPGYGAALMETGRWAPFPTNHVAGKSTLADPAALAAFCAYLAGE